MDAVFQKEIYVETGALLLGGFLHHTVFVNVISFTVIYITMMWAAQFLLRVRVSFIFYF